MWPANALTERLGLKWPVIQAPMGIMSTASLAAAVSNAGGLGGLGMWGLSAEDGGRRIAGFRQLSGGSLNFGQYVARGLLEGKKIKGVDLWVVPVLNPDGLDKDRRWIAGHVDLIFMELSAANKLHQGGKARILAVMTDHRVSALPEIPTMAEVGVKDLESDTFNAISAPPKTPRRSSKTPPSSAQNGREEIKPCAYVHDRHDHGR